MRSPYDDFSVVSDSGDEARANSYNYSSNNNSSAIPYHARENSLPFSYGQINKASTPLRSISGDAGTGGLYRNQHGIGVGVGSSGIRDFGLGPSSSPSKADMSLSSGTDHYYGTNYKNASKNGLTATLKSTTAKTSASGSGTDTTNTIKAQPRLTSPILVRKTLNSRSPTRNGATNTNTIANTYHYKYGNDNDSAFYATAGSSDHSNALNGNISGYNNGYGSTKRYNNNNFIYGNNNNNSEKFEIGDTIDGSLNVRRTQPRDDFDQLLRERREKVMREHYRPTGTTPIVNGSGGTFGTSPDSRKFNYDFEFHLNLDDAPPPPRRAHTMDRTSLQQLQQYRTRDIPVAREVAMPTSNSTYVERNYHTISSSNASREASGPFAASHQQSRILQQQSRPQPQSQQQQQLESLYSTVEKRVVPPSRRQYSPSPSPTQSQQERRLEYSRYGNGNAAGYGVDSSHEYATNNRSSLGAAVVARSRNDLSSPIYATTSKQVTAATSTYHSRNSIEPALSVTDHPMAASLSLPVGPASTVAATANAVEAGKISPSPLHVARPETPAFPVTPRTPYGGYNGQNSPIAYSHSPVPQRPDLPNGKSMLDLHNFSSETIYRTSCRPRLDSNMSMVNSEPQEVAAHLVKFAKDSSKYWYKPNLSREEAVQLLLHAEPGTFIVRNSTTYKDNYGLVVRVHQPPPNSELTGQPDDLVRHFLIEPTNHGVRLKSCANEPVFTSLSALIY
ncbi:tensin-2, partial [Rhagoletis pomonella]|uniref:tensin-2 n=1 Tax=Rhagoletis pomonella TaxID=28610 RepID=UPI00178053D6